MKRVLVVLVILLSAFMRFTPSAAAEEPPVLTARSTLQENGEVSVTFSLDSLPNGSSILYAQIELSLQPGDFTLQKESFSWLPNDEDVLVTPQWNGDSLLLLLEPETVSFAGLDAQPLFSLRLQNNTGGKTDPVFNITCIFIDQTGQETLYTAEISGITGEAVSSSGDASLSVSPDASSPEEDISLGEEGSHSGGDTGTAIPGWLCPLLIVLACCLLVTAAAAVLILRKKRRAGDGMRENHKKS